jgi:hypothetical protein
MELTAKEKAAAMILKYTIILEYDFVSDLKWYPPNDKYRNQRIKKDAKKCALIAVDEILRVCPYINEKKRETVAQLEAFVFQFVSYWEQVKKEINNL